MEEGRDPEPLGWDAIDKAFEKIYGDQEPMHYAAMIKYWMGGPDPLDGISVFRSDNGVPHWHYVSYGFTELYEKEGDNPEYSGYGFELTMRLLRSPDEEVPQWPLSLMQNFARYVFESGNIFEAGHYLDCNGPVALETDTQLKAVLFVPDPELKSIDTPNGKVSFLQIVCATVDELQAAKRWNTLGLAKLIEERFPLMITDLKRGSILTDQAALQAVEDGVSRDGSSTGCLFVTQLDYKLGLLKKCELTVGAIAVPELQSLLPARLGHGNPLILAGGQRAVHLLPEEKFYCKEVNGALHVGLTKAETDAFINSLSSKEGVYKICDGLTIKVEKTEIKDSEGKVVQVLG
jgi:hypothetical protein